MKKQKLLAVMAAAILLAACNTNSADNADEQSITEASAQVSASVSETSAETTAETEAAAESYIEPEYVEVSVGNEFIDFEFIEDYQGTSDIGDLADKAVEFFKTTDEYAESMKNISEFSDGEFSDYIADGVIVPKFNIAYPNDYDGDGREETFISVDMPVHYDSNILTSFYIYADSSENMTLLEVSGKPDENAVFLNYGRDKQIAFGGGLSPYGSVCYLYGVKDGDPVLLYSEQAGLEKRACFLRSHGFQAAEYFMYYDTAAREYRQIASVRIPNDELKALDTSGSLNSVFEEHGDNFSAWVAGGKYYFIKIMFEFADVYTYNGGTFTLMNDPPVGLNIPESFMPAVIDIDIDKAIAEMKPPVKPYAKVSEDNVFIDYEFIEDYQGTTEIGVLAAGAVEFLTESEYYADSTENIGEFTDEKFKKYFDESGNILPRLQTAYPEDYDGDGSTETFIIVDMPIMQGDLPLVRSFLIFADSRGEMTLLSDASGLFDTLMLDYGDFKQITFGGSGTCGADERNDLYGVVNGKAKHLYGMRGSFHKKDCFLSVFGAQGGGAFMYYDTAACEYRAIAGEDIPIEKIKEMDTTNALSEFYEWLDEHGFLYAELIGGRYYVMIRGAMDTGTAYLYENGEFIQNEDCKYVRDSHYNDIRNVVLDIDITKAIAEMKPPEEPYVKVSDGNEFTDFEFIEKYQGTADIGDLADKAADFLKTTDFYAESMKNIDKFSGAEFSDYISDGVIVPKFNIAYPNDYDGDGRTETFIMADMPYFWNEYRPVIRNILIFSDSGGEMEVVGDYSCFDPDTDATLLNYGKYKHIIIYADGTCGGDMHVSLYGVKSGKAVNHYEGRCSYEKDKCFLKVNGYQGTNCFLYFDTEENEYRSIVGVPVSIDEMKAIDSENFFEDYYSLFEKEGFVYFELVSKNYYRVYRDLWEPAAVYKYENGKFTRINGSGISNARNAVRYSDIKAVIDIDIDKAIAEMKSVK